MLKFNITACYVLLTIKQTGITIAEISQVGKLYHKNETNMFKNVNKLKNMGLDS